jgi:hypothetical protein
VMLEFAAIARTLGRKEFEAPKSLPEKV